MTKEIVNPSTSGEMNELKLRPYREVDLEDLHYIDGLCFTPAIAYSREELRDFIGHPGAITLVAECNLKIIGFVVTHREPHHLGHIITLDILAEWRRRRVGTLLMDSAEERLRVHGPRIIYLETAVENHTAIRFYQKRGYGIHDRVENYYADGSAAAVMAKVFEARDGSQPIERPIDG